VRPVLIVVPAICLDDGFEVAAADDQQPVEALAADAADPPLGMSPRLRRPHRRLDHSDPFGTEDLVELAGELAVSVTDQEPRPDALVVEFHQQVACLLGHPRPIRVRRDPSEVDTPGRELDKEQDIKPLEEERVDGEEIAFEDARRLLAQKVSPARVASDRFGAGSIPSSRRIVQTVLAASLIPSPTNSPWIRRYPQPAFSRASRTISSRISSGVAGRPGGRCDYVQRRATSSRCQRNSVAGVTNADLRHARLGSTRLNAANSALSAGVNRGRAT
jgi:hypothetical protein